MEDPFAQRIELIRKPADPSTLQASAPIRIHLFKSEEDLDRPRIVDLEDVPLYYTVEEFARAFWLKMGKADTYAPDNVFFGVPQTDAPASSTWYVNLKTLTYAGKRKEVIGLKHPYRRILYKEYVGKEGNRQVLKSYDRRKISLEDVFYGDETLPILHAYTLDGILESYGGRDAISAKIWNGAVYPFFQMDEARTLGPRDRLTMTKSVEEKRIQRAAIQRVLEATPIVENEEYALSARGIKQISYLWSKKPVEFPGVDMIFYNSDVNEMRPFMRFYPRTGTVMNKLYHPNPLDDPYVNDPLLLRSWAAEKTPSPGDDFLMIKTEIRRSDPPLYGTFRVNGDGSADFIMLPPKTVRVLDPVYDLSRFYNSIQATIEGTSYKIEDAQFYRGTFIYELRIPAQPKKMVREQIAARVEKISRYFQINAPHKDKAKKDNTFIMLRYKAVSNYAKEDALELFITQWMEKGGDILTREGLEAVMAEFDMEESAASEGIRNYMDKRGQFGIADEEDKHFVAAFNPGIDVNVYYDNYNTFTFHIYRVDSIRHLQRLTSLLQILFLSSDATWNIQTSDLEAAGEDDLEELEDESADSNINVSNVSDDSNIVDISRRKPAAATAKPTKVKISEESDGSYDTSTSTSTSAEEDEAADEINPIVDADCDEAKKTKLTPEKTKEFFMDNLKQVDRVLTDYTSLPKYKGKGYKSYSSKCQVQDFRQPFALTKAQYEQIKNIYAEDLKKDMAFIVYGTETYKNDLKRAAEIQKKALKESKYEPDIYTVLRYGSDPRHLNYYICAEYVCIKDKILIRKRDFKSNKKRDGITAKPGINITRVPESEWERGDNKGVGSCPFCCGSLIVNKKSPGLGETVLQRHVKKQGKVPMLDIGFLAKDPHPEGYGLPCCFVPKKDKKGKMYDGLKWDSPVFDHIRKEEEKASAAAVPTDPSKSNPIDESQKKIPTKLQKGQKTKDLSILRTEVHREYIADETKYPANYGSVAKASPALDAYFGQKSEQLVTREKQRQIINPQTYGFFRVGVTQDSYDSRRSFFAALAPILGRNSPEEIIQDFAIGDDHISQVIKPHIYTNLNFGNLLLEFFNPGDYEKYVTEGELNMSLEQFKDYLQSFSTEYIGGSTVTAYQYELTRLFLSYRRFIDYVQGKTGDRIQYRHFFHMLAERGLFVRHTADEATKDSVNGLTIIVLEYKGDPTDPATQVEVRCPPYGFDMARYEKNDVCFMTVDQKGFWEPLLYIEPVEIGSTQRQAYYRIPYQKFASTKADSMPQNIRERFYEFRNKCSAGAVYRGIYTAQVGVDSSTLLPFCAITDTLIKNKKSVDGILRDSYNHLVGAFVSYDSKKPSSGIIIIPASDDGDMKYFDSVKKIYLGFDPTLENDGIFHYKSYADAVDVHHFYNGAVMERIIIKNPGYALKSFICVPKKKAAPNPADLRAVPSCDGGRVVGFRLQNGVLLPCRPTGFNEFRQRLGEKFASITMERIPYSAEFTFIQDKKMIKEPIGEEERKAAEKDRVKDKAVLKREDMEEIYTHFRLTFSNWIRSDDAGSQLNKRIHNLIMNRHDISTIEKRQLLTYVLGPMMQSWILQRDDDDGVDAMTSLIRKDCIHLAKGYCDGRCAWKEVGGVGRCLLHVPKTIPGLGPADADADADEDEDAPVSKVAEYFTNRLIYELVNLPLTYHEVINGTIPRVAPLKTNIHIEGETDGVKDQWILPENVPAWHDLLFDPRAGAPAAAEKPAFYEEFSDEGGLKAQEDTDAVLEAVFGSAVAAQLVVKKIGFPGSASASPAKDVLIYYDVLEKANRALWTQEVQRSNSPLTTELIKNLSTLIGGYPIVFINGTDNSITYGLNVSLKSKKEQVHIILYNKNEDNTYEASVVIPYGLLLEYVPLERLQGTEVFNTIRDAPLVARQLVAPPAPAPAPEPTDVPRPKRRLIAPPPPPPTDFLEPKPTLKETQTAKVRTLRAPPPPPPTESARPGPIKSRAPPPPPPSNSSD